MAAHRFGGPYEHVNGSTSPGIRDRLAEYGNVCLNNLGMRDTPGASGAGAETGPSMANPMLLCRSRHLTARQLYRFAKDRCSRFFILGHAHCCD